MLVVKIILGTVIVGITTYLGILKSKKLYDREYILREFVSFLGLVENEIKYCLTILPNAYESSRVRLSTKLKDCMGNIVQDILEGKEMDKSIVDHISSLDQLTSYDKNIMISCLKNLGRSNVESQINIIENNVKILENQIKEAVDYKTKNSKIYRTVGTISGLIVVILFV